MVRKTVKANGLGGTKINKQFTAQVEMGKMVVVTDFSQNVYFSLLQAVEASETGTQMQWDEGIITDE